ncbi:MAG: tetratricopeptide repeat protein [Bacteroidales bacterium]|nr:tetratricopeptide repeat protein [Bacteroidales bacterium]
MAKQTGRKIQQSREESQEVTLVMVFPGQPSDLSVLAESLAKIPERSISTFPVVSVFGPDAGETESSLLSLLVYTRVVHREVHSGHSDPWQLVRQGLEKVSTRFAAVLFPHLMSRPFQLAELLSFKSESPGWDQTVWLPVFSDTSYLQESRRDGIPFIILPVDFGLYLSDTLKGEPFNLGSLMEFCRKIDKTISPVRFNQPDPFVVSVSSKKKHSFSGLKGFWKWYVVLPWAERKNKSFQFLPHSESSLYRLIFIALAALLFIIMPLLSLDAGISGDEDVNYVHAGYVYNFYKTLGKDTTCLNTPVTRLQYYGQSFDNFTFLFNKTFGIEHVYEWRHVFNSLTGWLAILFAGLTAAVLAGWRAGILTMVLMFLTPVFLGHSFNNPKDIPFALGYIWSVYGIVLFLKNYPFIRWKHILLLVFGIAFTLSIRAGGLLQIVYFAFFAGLYFLITSERSSFFSAGNIKRMRNMILWVAGISIAGYIVGILWWPYALQNPVKNVLASLRLMTNFDASLRQVFEGKYIWSDNVPWYYIPKYILITLPLAVLFGLLLYASFFRTILKRCNRLFTFLLLFAWIFPVAYVIGKSSNVYGSWRHLLFVFPPLAVTSAIGWNMLFTVLKKKYAILIVGLLFTVLLFLPLRHFVANHPLEYIYYNELVGGVKGAYGNYETDYYYHSIRPGSLWLKEKLTSENNPEDTVIVATNFLPSLRYYFRDLQGKVKPVYTRYYDKGEADWDYGVFACSYLNPYQLKKKYYPPRHTIHTVTVDGVPVCAVMQRTSKADLEGTRLLEKGQYEEACKYFRLALADNPDNETALMNMGRCFIEMQQPDSCIPYATRLLKIYPDYDKGFNLLGVAYLTKRELTQAISIFEHTIKVNPKFVTAYFNLGLTYARMNNINMAERYLQKAIEVGPSFKPAYLVLADIWRQQGRTSDAQQLLEYASTLP